MLKTVRNSRRCLPVCLAALWLSTAQVQAWTFEFPGPTDVTAALREGLTSYRLPTGTWDGKALPVRLAEGALDRQAFRVDAPGLTTLELLAPLRDQLAAEGFATVFECDTEGCGGFDFRYGTDILPEPDMHVDLGDFRFFAAERGAEVVSLIVSRSSRAGFVQVTRISPVTGGAPLHREPPRNGQALLATLEPRLSPPADTALPVVPGGRVTLSASGALTGQDTDIPPLMVALEQTGGVVLEDLVFSVGTSSLAPGDYPSLAALADWLRADPGRTVALVGHTDAVGGLDANRTLAKRRADSVRAKLIARHGVRPAQVTADGVGYLAPRDSNLTEEGRQRNRRVEAVVTSTR